MEKTTIKGKTTGDVKYLSVTEVLKVCHDILVKNLPTVYFIGELGPVSRPASGHMYFSIKDNRSAKPAVIAGVMWRGLNSRLAFKPEQGMEVMCIGRPAIYAGNGKFQIVVEKMLLAGEGALQQKFEELKKKLTQEGLFSEDRKRELPFFPKTIGIVTSGTGAVIHDIMVKIRERMPSTKVIVADSRVQGHGAAQELANGVAKLNAIDKVEVIIVARGGGSLEDLWAFNEEVLVRAIFASSKPTISGVGHEVDITLSDLVADVRAPTPTAAAEIVVPHREALLETLRDYYRRFRVVRRIVDDSHQAVDELAVRLDRSIDQCLENKANTLNLLKLTLDKHEPVQKISARKEKLINIKTRLNSGVFNRVEKQKAILENLSSRLEKGTGQLLRPENRRNLEQLRERLIRAVSSTVATKSLRLENVQKRIDSINPNSVLKRGYAMVKVGGSVVTKQIQIEKGARFNLRMSDGVVLGERIE